MLVCRIAPCSWEQQLACTEPGRGNRAVLPHSEEPFTTPDGNKGTVVYNKLVSTLAD